MKHIIIEITFAIDFFCDRIIAPKITCAPRTSVSDFSVRRARNARSVFITKFESDQSRNLRGLLSPISSCGSYLESYSYGIGLKLFMVVEQT